MKPIRFSDSVHKKYDIAAILLAPVISYYLMETITHSPFEIPFQLQLLGWLFSYLLTGLIFFLTGRMRIALVLPQIFMAVLGTANYYVLSCRQSPILPWDIASLGTALAVADHFTFTITPRLILVLAGYLVLIILSLFVRTKMKGRWGRRAVGTAATIAVSALYVLCLQNDAILNALDVYEMPFTQDYTYEQNGFFVSFLMNTKYLKVEKPEGYSADTASQLLQEADAEAEQSEQEQASGLSGSAAGSSDENAGSSSGSQQPVLSAQSSDRTLNRAVQNQNTPQNTSEDRENSGTDADSADNTDSADVSVTDTSASADASGADSAAVPGDSGTVSENSEASGEEEMPNIIVIMNEAFSDLSVIGDFETSEDYMPFFRSLYGSENTISGSLHVSVLGGNTANTEFEFLTGDSMAFLPTGSIPYQQYISDELPALPAILEDYGYSTTGLHPYIARGWKRNQVYPLLGFENCLFSTDFLYKDRMRGYITDASAFNQVIHEYEKQEESGSDSPFFAFLVTMQNHGGYSQDWTGFERTVTVEGMDDLNLPRINAYLTLLKETDDAFRDLISYYENSDEKTIVLMFGDHQPNVETAFLEELYGKDYDDLTEEELALRYQTPFVLWANYDIEEAEDVQISANYLSTLLMDVAGLEKTAYQNFLSSLREELPVITANYCIDADGNFYSSAEYDELETLLSDYEIIQYNHLFDTENRDDREYLP